MKKYADNAEDAGIVTKNSSLDENLIKKLETLSKEMCIRDRLKEWINHC